MNTLVPILLAIVIAGALGVYLFLHHAPAANVQTPQMASSAQPATLPDAYSTPGQRSYYTNDQFGFVFEIPKGYHIEEYGVKDKDPQVLLASNDQQDLMLVWIYPLGNAAMSGKDITTDFIHQVNPNFGVSSALAPIAIAGADGVEFDSMGQTWDNGHRYWFIHDGTLFRVSTSKRLQDVQQAVLSTWRFTD